MKFFIGFWFSFWFIYTSRTNEQEIKHHFAWKSLTEWIEECLLPKSICQLSNWWHCCSSLSRIVYDAIKWNIGTNTTRTKKKPETSPLNYNSSQLLISKVLSHKMPSEKCSFCGFCLACFWLQSNLFWCGSIFPRLIWEFIAYKIWNIY